MTYYDDTTADWSEQPTDESCCCCDGDTTETYEPATYSPYEATYEPYETYEPVVTEPAVYEPAVGSVENVPSTAIYVDGSGQFHDVSGQPNPAPEVALPAATTEVDPSVAIIGGTTVGGSTPGFEVVGGAVDPNVAVVGGTDPFGGITIGGDAVAGPGMAVIGGTDPGFTSSPSVADVIMGGTTVGPADYSAGPYAGLNALAAHTWAERERINNEILATMSQMDPNDPALAQFNIDYMNNRALHNITNDQIRIGRIQDPNYSPDADRNGTIRDHGLQDW